MQRKKLLFTGLLLLTQLMVHATDIPGDVNSDNAVDVADISAVISVMAGGMDEQTAKFADVNHDGAVDIADISAIISIMAGSYVQQPKWLKLWQKNGSSAFFDLQEHPQAIVSGSSMNICTSTQQFGYALDDIVKFTFEENARTIANARAVQQQVSSSGGGNVKILVSRRQLEVIPISEIDSISFHKYTLSLPPMDAVSVDELRQLTHKMYPTQSPAMICELSGDNMIDNNAYMPNTNFKSYRGLYDRLFSWEAVGDDESYANAEDSPLAVWRDYSEAIAVCNYIIEAAQKAEGRFPEQANEIVACRAEALMMRSYLRSVLAGVFHVDYASDIEADLQAALPLIGYLSDGDASHMGRRAAYAYAARHYMLKHDWNKVVTYATAALGNSPETVLRDWSVYNNANNQQIIDKLTTYYDVNSPCNFMVQRTYSYRDRMLSACKYATNGVPADILFTGGGPVWSGYMPCFNGGLYKWNSQDYGIWLFKSYEFFEYTDESLGIGYVINCYTPFTADETILMRAEARFYKGDTDGCLADLNLWLQSRLVSQSLTVEDADNFYGNKTQYQNEIHMAETGWPAADVAKANDNKSLLDCILHFRRIETIYDGLRWMDIQRYGITVRHDIRYPYSETIHDSICWHADTQSLDSRYFRAIPNTKDEYMVSIHLKGDSVLTFSTDADVKIYFGGSDTYDQTVADSFLPAANGWVLQTFDLLGDGQTEFISNDKCRLLSDDLMEIDQYGNYKVLSQTPGEEVLLQDLQEDSNYPKKLRLAACPMPWDEYQKQCDSIMNAMWRVNIFRCGNVWMNHDNLHCLLSQTPEFDNVFRHCPFVYTEKGIRFADESVLSCSPEFVLDTAAGTLTSDDEQVQFKYDFDYAVQQLIANTNKRFDIYLESENNELQEILYELDSYLQTLSSNYKIRGLFFGKSIGTNSTNGIGVEFYTNKAKTRTNTFGAVSTMTLQDGLAVLTTPGLDDGTVTMDRNATTITEKIPQFKEKFLDLLRLLEGEYLYTLEIYAEGYDLRMVKKDNPDFAFSIHIQ